MSGAVEFSRPVRLDQIGDQPRGFPVEADAGERAALAGRFRLIALDALDATFDLSREGVVVTARGRVRGRVVQACVASGEPVPATIDEAVELRFLPETAGSEDELELGADEVDTVFYAGGAIDLGEAAAETLALALDPYPRSPNAAAALKAAGVVSEGEAGPFGALAALRDRLPGKA